MRTAHGEREREREKERDLPGPAALCNWATGGLRGSIIRPTESVSGQSSITITSTNVSRNPRNGSVIQKFKTIFSSLMTPGADFKFYKISFYFLSITPLVEKKENRGNYHSIFPLSMWYFDGFSDNSCNSLLPGEISTREECIHLSFIYNSTSSAVPV